jgi:hypothetical protein
MVSTLGQKMKYHIDEEHGSEAFRVRFDEIRDHFVEKLDAHIGGRRISTCRACDEEGKPFPWLWNNDTLKFEHLDGSIEDAKMFLVGMVDEGMSTAFMGASGPDGFEIWVTSWEDPDPKPKWPRHLTPEFEESHEGVRFGEDEGT